MQARWTLWETLNPLNRRQTPAGSRSTTAEERSEPFATRVPCYSLPTTDQGQLTTDEGLHAIAADQPLDALRNRRSGGKKDRSKLSPPESLAAEQVVHPPRQ